MTHCGTLCHSLSAVNYVYKEIVSGPLLESNTYLSYIIISISFQSDMNSLCHKSTETLPCRACEPHIDTVLWQPIITMPPVQGTLPHHQTSHWQQHQTIYFYNCGSGSRDYCNVTYKFRHKKCLHSSNVAKSDEFHSMENILRFKILEYALAIQINLHITTIMSKRNY